MHIPMNALPQTVISTLLVMVGLVAMTYFAGIQAQQYLKNQAVDACMEMSIVDWEDQNGSGTNLVPEWQKSCLEKKGY